MNPGKSQPRASLGGDRCCWGQGSPVGWGHGLLGRRRGRSYVTPLAGRGKPTPFKAGCQLPAAPSARTTSLPHPLPPGGLAPLAPAPPLPPAEPPLSPQSPQSPPSLALAWTDVVGGHGGVADVAGGAHSGLLSGGGAVREGVLHRRDPRVVAHRRAVHRNGGPHPRDDGRGCAAAMERRRRHYCASRATQPRGRVRPRYAPRHAQRGRT